MRTQRLMSAMDCYKVRERFVLIWTRLAGFAFIAFGQECRQGAQHYARSPAPHSAQFSSRYLSPIATAMGGIQGLTVLGDRPN